MVVCVRVLFVCGGPWFMFVVIRSWACRVVFLTRGEHQSLTHRTCGDSAPAAGPIQNLSF